MERINWAARSDRGVSEHAKSFGWLNKIDEQGVSPPEVRRFPHTQHIFRLDES